MISCSGVLPKKIKANIIPCRQGNALKIVSQPEPIPHLFYHAGYRTVVELVNTRVHWTTSITTHDSIGSMAQYNSIVPSRTRTTTRHREPGPGPCRSAVLEYSIRAADTLKCDNTRVLPTLSGSLRPYYRSAKRTELAGKKLTQNNGEDVEPGLASDSPKPGEIDDESLCGWPMN